MPELPIAEDTAAGGLDQVLVEYCFEASGFFRSDGRMLSVSKEEVTEEVFETFVHQAQKYKPHRVDIFNRENSFLIIPSRLLLNVCPNDQELGVQSSLHCSQQWRWPKRCACSTP